MTCAIIPWWRGVMHAASSRYRRWRARRLRLWLRDTIAKILNHKAPSGKPHKKKPRPKTRLRRATGPGSLDFEWEVVRMLGSGDACKAYSMIKSHEGVAPKSPLKPWVKVAVIIRSNNP